MADVKGLEVESGEWVAANCGKFPSDRNCKLVMMAPQSQKSDLVDAAVAHAVKDHGHQDTPELRAQLSEILDVVRV
jgi:Protein of unknown function (DUF1059)